MADERLQSEPSSDALVPTAVDRMDLGALVAAEPGAEEFGHWWPTVLMMRRLGASGAQRLGSGLGLRFGRFSIETQVYPTKGVAAIGHKTHFRLSSAVAEKNSFSVMLYDGGEGRDLRLLGVGFGPMPEGPRGVDAIELAKRYGWALAGVFDSNPGLVDGAKLLAQALGLLPGGA